MTNIEITDELLYKHIGKARDIVLSTLLSDDEIPEHKFSEKFERRMNRLIKQQKRSPKFNKTVLYLKRCAVAALLVFSVTFTGLMTVDAYREKVIEVIVKVFNELTDYRFVSNAAVTSSDLIEEIPEIEFGYIPEGMELTEEKTLKQKEFFKFENDKNNRFKVTQTIIANDSHNIVLDTEDSTTYKLFINDIEVTANIKNDMNTLIWNNKRVLYEIR